MPFTAEQARQYRKTHPENVRAAKRRYFRKVKALGVELGLSTVRAALRRGLRSRSRKRSAA